MGRELPVAVRGIYAWPNEQCAFRHILPSKQDKNKSSFAHQDKKISLINWSFYLARKGLVWGQEYAVLTCAIVTECTVNLKTGEIMKIQIVNNQDEPVGVKERSEIDYKNDIYRVSALWLMNSKGQTLLGQRAFTKDKDPGKWGPAVAGTIDEGETYDDNIYKEADEEIGLTGVRFVKGNKIRITYPRNCFFQWYFATIDRGTDTFKKQVDEVAELEWIDVEQVKQELQTNPDKYIPGMKQIVGGCFYDKWGV